MNKSNTIQIATLPTGIIGYLDIPLTTMKPSDYRIRDLNAHNHSVVHTCHPNIAQPNKSSLSRYEAIKRFFRS